MWRVDGHGLHWPSAVLGNPPAPARSVSSSFPFIFLSRVLGPVTATQSDKDSGT